MPASTTSLLTVVLLTPVTRVMARMLMPSQRRWRILARSVLSSLFTLAIMLERFRKSAHCSYRNHLFDRMRAICLNARIRVERMHACR